LVQSRHSIRYYLPTPPKKEDIEEALKIAQQTPSACNRQSWRTHVFMNQDSTSLLEQQGGANGFESEILCTILVTADMKAFLSYEPMQCYVDGGLYSMNLINALHSLGYGTIPLSCGFQQKKLDNIAKNFGIPDNEAMICMIGVGVLHDTLNIAVSHRKDITLTNTYHS
jgi:nitroreductase